MADRAPSTSTDSNPPRVGLIISVSLIAALIALLVSRTPQGQEPLQPLLLATGEWPPYSGEQLSNNGIAAAIVAAAFEQIGYRTQLHFMAWEPAESAARANQTNEGVRATFPYADTAERRRQFYYSEPLLEIEMALYYDRSRFPAAANITSPAQLPPFRILPVDGYRYPARFDPYFAAETAPAATVTDALQQMLGSEQPLIVIEARRVADTLLAQAPASCRQRIGSLPLTFASPLHLIASKRNPHNRRLITTFNQALNRLREQGTLAEIEQRSVTPPPPPRRVTLSPWRADRSLRGYPALPPTRHVLLPRGSEATILDWGDGWLQPQTAPPGSPAAMVRVSLLNGPLAGHAYYVDGRSILLPEPESSTWTSATSGTASTRNLCSPPPKSSTG